LYFPSSEKELIASVIGSLRKRHKALKHKVKSVTCDKVFEEHEGRREEKLEITLHGAFNDLRAFVWEDGSVWIDFRSRRLGRAGGWRWEWSYDGRLLPVHDGRTFIAALEHTLDAAPFSGDVADVSAFSAIWRPLLAQGPKPVG
jgi:hypothetical protein